MRAFKAHHYRHRSPRARAFRFDVSNLALRCVTIRKDLFVVFGFFFFSFLSSSAHVPHRVSDGYVHGPRYSRITRRYLNAVGVPIECARLQPPRPRGVSTRNQWNYYNCMHNIESSPEKTGNHNLIGCTMSSWKRLHWAKSIFTYGAHTEIRRNLLCWFSDILPNPMHRRVQK